MKRQGTLVVIGVKIRPQLLHLRGQLVDELNKTSYVESGLVFDSLRLPESPERDDRNHYGEDESRYRDCNGMSARRDIIQASRREMTNHEAHTEDRKHVCNDVR